MSPLKGWRRLTLAPVLAATTLTGTASAGGSAELPLPELRSLLSLRGAAFDLAWLDQMRTQQDLLAGLDEFEGRYGHSPRLKRWAAADQRACRASSERLRRLKDRLQPPNAVSSTDVIVSILNGTEQDFLARFDAFFLTEYPQQSVRLRALARLGQRRSQTAALRQEAAAVLANETVRMNEFGRLK